MRAEPMTFALPDNLAATTRGEPGCRAWAAGLPALVAELQERWSLRLGPPFQPGGYTAWVAPATDRRGRELVLKVSWRHVDGQHEATALRLWNGDGAVLLHDEWSDDDTVALLLEACRPGRTLGATLSGAAEPEQDVIIAGLLRRLWRRPDNDHPFRTLRQMCTEWAEEFAEGLPEDHPDRGLAREGIELFRALPAESDDQVLICTDLHAANVLAAQREPWLVIDPKPHVGDRTYDALQHMLNCEERLAADPRGFAHRMADLLDLDPQRLTRWLFARCVQESIDNPVRFQVARDLAAR